jgi:ABC-2 type transport system ATP-binding protein
LRVLNPESALTGKLASAFAHLDFQSVSAGQVRVESSDAVPIGSLVRFLEDEGVEVTEARLLRPSLEEVFVNVTGIEPDALKKEKEKVGGPA